MGFNMQNSMMVEAEEAKKKVDPYTRSRSRQPLDDNAVVIGGTSNPNLTKEIEKYLGKSLAKTRVIRFADGETHVKIFDNVNGKNVYILQPTCPPVNENVMELILTISAAKRAGAASITVIAPYYGYAR
jgi:ribose-phosphate pyrophosphokinase